MILKVNKKTGGFKNYSITNRTIYKRTTIRYTSSMYLVYMSCLLVLSCIAI